MDKNWGRWPGLHGTTRWPLALAATLLVAFSAAQTGCSSDDGAGGDSSADAAGAAADGGGADGSATDSGGSPDAGGEDATGAAQGPWTPKPYSGGTCPGIIGGAQLFASGGVDRRLVVAMPAQPEGAPVLFLWHGLGDSPENFSGAFGASALADQYGVIVVAPEPISGPIFPPDLPDAVAGLVGNFIPETWAFFGEPEADLMLFDDVVSCLDAFYDIDRSRVYTAGFSAGAMWSTLLVMHRADYLAAAALFSGGSMFVEIDLGNLPPPYNGLNLGEGKVVAADTRYQTPPRKIPLLLTWGGMADYLEFVQGMPQYAFDFDAAAQAFIAGAKQDGLSMVTCNHGGGHTPPAGAQVWGMDFLFRHAFGDEVVNTTPDTAAGTLPSICSVVE